MKAKALIVLVLLIIVSIVGLLLFRNASQQTGELISKGIPEIPSEIANQELANRIDSSTTQARNGPDRLEALAELSRLYHANGYTTEAWRCYAALTLADPKEPRWHYRFGRILAGYGQLEEATPYFEAAVKRDPDYLPSGIRLGDTLLKQNRLEEARSAYEKVIGKNPKNAYALLGLARVEIAEENWPAARAHLETAVKATNYQIGGDLLGDVYENLGLDAEERLVLKKLAWGSYADIPDPWSLELMDDCYDAYQVSIAGGWVAHQGDVRKGLRYVKRAVELDPDSSILHYQIAGLYMKLGDSENAEIHFQRCVELQPDFADAWLALIEIAKQKQSPTLVRRTLDKAYRAAPDSPSLNIELGKLLLAQRRFEQAFSYFERSIELRPHEAIGYIELAQAYLKADRVEDGVEMMREALRREPNNPIALSTLAYDAILKSDFEQANKWINEAIKQPRLDENAMNSLIARFRETFGRPPVIEP